MLSVKEFLGGALAGAAAEYLLDPNTGRRRRALMRDQALHRIRILRDEVEAGSRDAANRARGAVASVRRVVQSDAGSDAVVAERVRSELGRHVTHPAALDVSVEGGRVRVRGPILANEVERARRAVRRLRGVAGLDDDLEVHAEAGDVPGLQGPGRQPGSSRAAPALRLLVGALALTGLGAAVARNGRLLGVTLIGILADAVVNVERARIRSQRETASEGHSTA